MKVEATAADLAFSDELSRWLDQALGDHPDPHEWHRRLVAGRWAVPAWPERFGGRACSLTQEILYHQQLGARAAPVPRNAIALFNIGPMLLSSGTPAQQERYLPKMVSAEEIWCQGFSEPNAGSDLASLSTRAEDCGDHWKVTGQKTWNTFANEASLCLALARTDPKAAKHKGISALIVPMRAAGVEVRPLREITGDDGFNEIFFTDVVVPKGNIVGQVNGGWGVAMSTLLHERLGTMKLGTQLEQRLQTVVALARESGRSGDPLIRQELARLAIEVELMQLLTADALRAMQRGADPGALPALGKLQWSSLMQELAELAVRLLGSRAQLYRGSKHEAGGDWPYHCVYSRMTTIGAGTTQVQKNILAYRSLGLPRDADVPSGPALSRDRWLPEEQALLRQNVRRFLRERCPVSYVRKMYADATGSTAEVWGDLARLGVLGILVPEQHGGLGLGYAEMGVVLEEVGRALLPGPFSSSALAAVAALLASGDVGAQAEYLPAIATGSRVATLGLLEPGRDDWRAPATRATLRENQWLLTGTKIAPDGAAADLLLVSAMSDGELGLFVLEAKDAQVTPLVAVDGTRKLAELSLKDARARRLGIGSAIAALSRVVDLLRIGWVADAVGAADRALELATEYAKVRRQFDRPIGAFQAVQHLLADMLRNVELARASVAEALRVADEGDAAALHRAATLTAAFASDALYRVTADAIQVLGGIGFTWEHDAHLYYKRTWSMRASVGAAADLREEFARLMLEAQPSTTRLAL